MNKTTPMTSKPLVDVTCKLGKNGCFDDGRCHALCDCANKITTNADRIRAMSDEEMVNAVIALYNKLGSGAMNDLSDLFCDGQAGCITKSGVVRCSEKKEKSCVLRWLQSPAKEG